MSERVHQIRGKDLQPGDVIANLTDRLRERWYGQIERLIQHDSFEGWQVAEFYNARPISIDPDEGFYVKRSE